MKKILAWTLLGVIALSVVGCKSDTEAPTTPDTTNSKGTPPSTTTPTPETGK